MDYFFWIGVIKVGTLVYKIVVSIKVILRILLK